jgi:hypothetical protein
MISLVRKQRWGMKTLSSRVKAGSAVGICSMIAMTCSLALGQATPATVPLPEPGSFVVSGLQGYAASSYPCQDSWGNMLGDGVPICCIVARSSSRRISDTRSIAPGRRRRAPIDRAGQRSRLRSGTTMSGSASIVEPPPSSTRPPWFDTTIPPTPRSAAIRASVHEPNLTPR